MRTTLILIIFFSFSSLVTKAEVISVNGSAFCLACNVPDGLAVSNLTGASATLSWNAVPGATQYTIEVEDEQNVPSTFHIETNVIGTSYNVTGLQAGVHYKFKVRTRCGGDKSDWSDWMFFIAGNGGGGTGNCPVVTGLSTSTSNGTVTLTWNAVAGAVKYYIEVEDEQNTPSTFHLEDSTLTNTYLLTGLQAGVSYKFKVRAHCAGGQSDWSGWMFFNGNNGGGSTGSCATPTGLNTSNIAATSATLSWDLMPGVASYTVEIERKKPGAQWQMTKLVTTNSLDLTDLDPNTRYKFKVRANCTGGGHSDWSPWRKFKTLVSATGSGNTNLVNPSENRNANAEVLLQPFEMQVYPNPAIASTTIRMQNLAAGSTTLRMFNLAGVLVKEQFIQSESNAWEGVLNVGDLSNGLYLIQIINGTNSKSIKLVVSQ